MRPSECDGRGDATVSSLRSARGNSVGAECHPQRSSHPNLTANHPIAAFDLAEAIEASFGGVIARDACKIARFVCDWQEGRK